MPIRLCPHKQITHTASIQLMEWIFTLQHYLARIFSQMGDKSELRGATPNFLSQSYDQLHRRSGYLHLSQDVQKKYYSKTSYCRHLFAMHFLLIGGCLHLLYPSIPWFTANALVGISKVCHSHQLKPKLGFGYAIHTAFYCVHQTLTYLCLPNNTIPNATYLKFGSSLPPDEPITKNVTASFHKYPCFVVSRLMTPFSAL